MDARIATIFGHDLPKGKNRYRRLQAENLFAWLTNCLEPINRTERRAQAKRLRRMASASRGAEREIREKRVWRAWRKARRLARAA